MKKTNYFYLGIAVLYLLTCIILLGIITYLNILPFKYYLPIILIFILFNLISLYVFFKKDKYKKLKICICILCLLFGGINIFASNIAFKSLKFYHEISSENTKKEIKEKYYILVKSDSSYNDISELNGITVGTFNENNTLYKNALDKLNDRVKINLKEYSTYIDNIESLLNGDNFAIFLSNFHYELYKNKNDISQLKVLDTIEVKTDIIEKESVTIPPVSKDSMTIFVSGIDVYGGINYRSRSDVNMLVTVNTKNHEVLLTSIPRDYYVQLHNTKGYKDKLTHAGIYGVNCSINTLKDLLGVDINYYVRVNFTTLIKVVDAIGGIDVYSDRNLNNGIKKGLNHMDGKTALMYSRERYAYIEGDRHRIRNQQDVITAIIDKLTKSPELLMRYTSLSEELSKYFQTNIDLKEISDIIKKQLDEMPTWEVGEYCLDGVGKSDYTYSMGKQKLYVMEPDMNTVNNASTYIKKISSGVKLKDLGIK